MTTPAEILALLKQPGTIIDSFMVGRLGDTDLSLSAAGLLVSEIVATHNQGVSTQPREVIIANFALAVCKVGEEADVPTVAGLMGKQSLDALKLLSSLK